MNDLRTAAQQALEALEAMNPYPASKEDQRASALAALLAALAQKEEPDLSRCPQCNGPADNGFDRSFPPSPYLCTKCMAKPVAWDVTKDGRVIYDHDFTHDVVLRVMGDFENDEQRISYAKQIVDKLNAAPPQRTMVPLTEEEIWALYLDDFEQSDRVDFARAVEKASWEKNK